MMRIDSLLNDGPSSQKSNAGATELASNIQQQPQHHHQQPQHHQQQPSLYNHLSDTSSPDTSRPLEQTGYRGSSRVGTDQWDGASRQNGDHGQAPYGHPSHSPYIQPEPHYRERTASTATRSSYRGSFSISSAATSPLEPPTPAHDPKLNESPYASRMKDTGINMSIGFKATELQRPQNQRGLPGFSSFADLQQPQPITPDGAISPRSVTGTGQLHVGPGGYFPASPRSTHYPNYYQQAPPPQSQHSGYAAPPRHQLPQPSANIRNSDSLMRFADVAIEHTMADGSRQTAGDGSSPAVRYSREPSGPDHECYRRVLDSPLHSRGNIDPSLSSVDGSAQGTPHAVSHGLKSMSTQTPASETPLFLPPSLSPPSPITATPILTTTETVREFLSRPPRCSYCNICTTNSPLRKVVSHIFGRNKLSTRQIPKNVWVYYCRKHYQRSRYRNPRGFARQQVLLVRRQCERLAQWGGVKDWVIKVRRREELRMNREENDLPPDGEDAHPSSPDISSDSNSRRSSIRRASTETINWIVKHTGTEKSIQDVYILLDRIETEVQLNGGKFPDVELLPNVDLSLAISLDDAEPVVQEGKTRKRRASESKEGAGAEAKKQRVTRQQKVKALPVTTQAAQEIGFSPGTPIYQPLHLPRAGNWDSSPGGGGYSVNSGGVGGVESMPRKVLGGSTGGVMARSTVGFERELGAQRV